jgi:hypothetical protein
MGSGQRYRLSAVFCDAVVVVLIDLTQVGGQPG